VSGQRRAVDPKTGRLYRILGPAKAAPRSFGAPPPALRKAHLDNLAIVPASLLPGKAEWQALANALPAGSTLIVLPGRLGQMILYTYLQYRCHTAYPESPVVRIPPPGTGRTPGWLSRCW
jgi:hypothetical protein